MKLHFFHKWNKTADRVFAVLIILVLLAGLVKTLFFPKEHNYYENRYSNQVSAPSVSTVMDHTFQDSFEEALADQIPKAESLKKLYNTFSSAMIDPLIRTISKNNQSVYIKFKGLKLFGDHIVYDCGYMDRFQTALDQKTVNYNAVITRHPEVDFYAYFIEKDTDINFETGRKLQAGEYVLSQLSIEDGNKGIFEVNSYEDFKTSFYRTDHHWNYRGSFLAYQQLHELLGCHGSVLQPQEEKNVFHRFSGSKAGSIGATTFTEDFTAYVFDFPSFEITQNGERVMDYGTQAEILSADVVSSLTYGSFYGADSGEVVFDSGNTELDNILIIGESFDNAILKLLASHYHQTFSVDLRNYEHFMGERFDMDQYIRDHQIDQVLFIGNLDFYVSDAFLLEYS